MIPKILELLRWEGKGGFTKRAFGLGVLPNPCVLRFLMGPMGTVHFSTKLSKT